MMRNTIIKVADNDETMTTITKIILTIMMTNNDYNGNYEENNDTMITMTRM